MRRPLGGFIFYGFPCRSLGQTIAHQTEFSKTTVNAQPCHLTVLLVLLIDGAAQTQGRKHYKLCWFWLSCSPPPLLRRDKASKYSLLISNLIKQYFLSTCEHDFRPLIEAFISRISQCLNRGCRFPAKVQKKSITFVRG